MEERRKKRGGRREEGLRMRLGMCRRNTEKKNWEKRGEEGKRRKRGKKGRREGEGVGRGGR